MSRSAAFPGASHFGARSSPHYTWHTKDLLGQGATGSVYKGIDKSTGETVAVKSFNVASAMSKSQVLLSREVSVMSSVSHPNIVRYLATEEENRGSSTVLVMELCNGGSLLNVLEEPRNSTGMAQEDFIVLLRDMTEGMKYLRKHEYIHRDMKPGNILRHVTDQGRVVYKITDFGAARQLDDGEVFHSIYGTYEYLHPEIFGKGVMHHGGEKNFTPLVDLWSLGVTLYQCATGKLPFRLPSGRSDLGALYRVISRKEGDVISGVLHQHGGQVEYKKTLPREIKLSKPFRHDLEKILRGVLQCNTEKAMSFEDFFSAVDSLLTKTVVHVFHANTCQLQEIRVDKEDQARVLLDKVHGFREAASGQADAPCELFWMPCVGDEIKDLALQEHHGMTIPRTAVSNPIVMKCGPWKDSKKLQVTKPFDLGSFEHGRSIDEDYKTAQTFQNWGHYVQQSLRQLKGEVHCLNYSASMISAVVSHEYRRVHYKHKLTMVSWQKLQDVWKATCAGTQPRMESLHTMVGSLEISSRAGMKELEQLRSQSDEVGSVINKVEQSQKVCVVQYEDISPPADLVKWDTYTAVGEITECEQQMHTMLETVAALCTKFRADRKANRTSVLSPYELTIHKGERQRLIRIGQEIKVVHVRCQQIQADLFEDLRQQWHNCDGYRKNVKQLGESLLKFAENMRGRQAAVNKFSDQAQQCFARLQERCLARVNDICQDSIANQEAASMSVDQFTRKQLEKIQELLGRLQGSYQELMDEASLSLSLATHLQLPK